MRGVKFSVPYHKEYSAPPSPVSQNRINASIKEADKVNEPIQFKMILVVVKSPDAPDLRYVTDHILSASHFKESPKGFFIEHKKANENAIEIHADASTF